MNAFFSPGKVASIKWTKRQFPSGKTLLHLSWILEISVELTGKIIGYVLHETVSINSSDRMQSLIERPEIKHLSTVYLI